jgi:hypothetical protein
MPRPTHSSRFYYPHNSGWGIQIMELLIMKFSPLPRYLSLLGPNILLNTLFSNTLSLRSSLNVSDQISHPYKTTGKVHGAIILKTVWHNRQLINLLVRRLTKILIQWLIC